MVPYLFAEDQNCSLVFTMSVFRLALLCFKGTFLWSWFIFFLPSVHINKILYWLFSVFFSLPKIFCDLSVKFMLRSAIKILTLFYLLWTFFITSCSLYRKHFLADTGGVRPQADRLQGEVCRGQICRAHRRAACRGPEVCPPVPPARPWRHLGRRLEDVLKMPKGFPKEFMPTDYVKWASCYTNLDQCTRNVS